MMENWMVLRVQHNRQLSDAGGGGRLHASGRGGDHAPSSRVRGVRPPPHLRPSGSLRSSASMPRRLAALRLGVDRPRNRRVP